VNTSAPLSRPPAVAALLAAFHARRPIRVGSLIVTIYGDAVAPRGGALWLGSLLGLLAPMGIGDGLVRTAMSRLAQDGWLERTRLGRNSHYRLADKGRRVFDAATQRIYFAAPGAWDGRWDMAILSGPAEARSRLRGGLEEKGFGALAPNVLLRPRGLAAEEASPDLLLLEAVGGTPEAARQLAATVWPLEDLAERYRRFIARFTDLGASDGRAAALAPLDALIVRSLLIHDYRRVILRDPLLPHALLPEDWPGAEARRLCGALYDAVRAGSEAWLDAHGITPDGPLPPPNAAFVERFRDMA
jgi:phenylacetic acid degradation operon negative regulatory protein